MIVNLASNLRATTNIIAIIFIAYGAKVDSCETMDYGVKLEASAKKIGVLQMASTKIVATNGVYIKKRKIHYSVLSPGFNISIDSLGDPQWKIYRIDSSGNEISNSRRHTVWLSQAKKLISVKFEYPTHYRQSPTESWKALKNSSISDELIEDVCRFAENDDHPSLLYMSAARMENGLWPIIMPYRIDDSNEGSPKERIINSDINLRAISAAPDNDSLRVSMMIGEKELKFGVGESRICKMTDAQDSLCIQLIR